MPDGSATLTMTLHAAIADVPAADWDACAGDGNPFVSHAFLSALEDSGSANARTGWLPQHAVLRDAAGSIVAAVPVGRVASVKSAVPLPTGRTLYLSVPTAVLT